MLKNLKSLFIVEDEPAAPNAKATGTPRPTTAPLSDQRTGSPEAASPERSAVPQSGDGGGGANSSHRQASSSAADGAINTAIVAKLLESIDRNDLQGFDYLEYKRSLKAMESLPMDEATKYRSAFATASTVGATLEKLVGSIDYYLNTLDQEKVQFDGVVERQFEQQVAGRRAELERLQDVITNKTEQIKKLQAEIDAHRASAQEISGSVDESDAKIESTKRDFGASFAYVKDLFVQDAEKMRRYLK